MVVGDGDLVQRVKPKTSMKKLYKQDLHEVIEKGDLKVIRVAGGWVYIYAPKGVQPVAVFVPFNDEFKNVIEA